MGSQTLSLFSLGLMALACQPAVSGPVAQKSWGGDSAVGAAFERAASESLVPAPLLIAMSYEDTRFVAPAATPSHDGAPIRYGIMGLTDGRVRDVARAAALTGVTIDQARTDDTANVRAAALLLSD